jgi:threonine aldolase
VFFDRALADDFAYRLKQAGQLASKMRFISAPWLGLLDDDVWLRNARHANAMAQLMKTRLEAIPGVSIMFPVESNAVFAQLPAHAAKAMRARGWKFYEFIGAGGCRLMCAWDTQPETVERFAAEVRELCGA